MTSAVLVTGGAGYIGAQTCKALSNAGYLPVTIDSLVTGYEQAVKWGPLIKADISDRQSVLEAIKTYDIKSAIHFAAFSLVGESTRDPAKYYKNNVGAAIAFTEALIEGGVENIVFVRVTDFANRFAGNLRHVDDFGRVLEADFRNRDFAADHRQVNTIVADQNGRVDQARPTGEDEVEGEARFAGSRGAADQHRALSDPDGGSVNAGAGRAHSAGSLTTKRAPATVGRSSDPVGPGRFSAQIRPPCASMICLEIDRPRPEFWPKPWCGRSV